MKKGTIEICILSVLHAKESYPSEILSVFKKHQFDIPEGTLYPVLTRLKKAKYLKYKWVESAEGPPRKYFSLTSEGEFFYISLVKVWKELQKSVNAIIKTKK